MFAEQICNSMEVYVDDMLIKSICADQHVANLAKTFAILREYGMKLNPAKCVFGVGLSEFLCFMVSHMSIEANLEKIQALIGMTQLRTQKEVQSLTGQVAALNHFISKATDRCLQFFKVFKGNNKIVDWTPECALEFENLKTHMR